MRNQKVKIKKRRYFKFLHLFYLIFFLETLHRWNLFVTSARLLSRASIFELCNVRQSRVFQKDEEIENEIDALIGTRAWILAWIFKTQPENPEPFGLFFRNVYLNRIFILVVTARYLRSSSIFFISLLFYFSCLIFYVERKNTKRPSTVDEF